MQRSDLLEPDRIKAGLKNKYIGSQIIVYKSTSSTNDIAAEYAPNPVNNGLAVFERNRPKGAEGHRTNG